MSHLFWKFFLAIWFAQVAAILVTGSAIWIKDRSQARHAESLELGPPARSILDGAEVAFRYGGTVAVAELLQKERREKVFAVNAEDGDLLGRQVDAAVLNAARRLHEQGLDAGAVRMVASEAAGTWLLFVERGRREPPPGGKDSPMTDGPMTGMEPASPHDKLAPPPGIRFPWMSVVLAMLASFVSAALLAWHFVRPVRKLRQVLGTAALGDLSVRVDPAVSQRRDELGDLGQEFNRMASQLQSLLNSQRRLLHDVSHELRSPMARLQVAIGLLRQRPERMEPSLERIERESRRMNHLIDSLLTLSRLETGTPGAMDDLVDIGELLRDIVNDARYEAQAAGKHVTLDVGGVREPTLVRGRMELLHSAVENVVRNALRHTPEGECVEIVSRPDRQDGRVHIQVRDHGPGVPPDEIDHIFEPFVQGSSISWTPGGYGLGLAIAQRVVHAHGGTIRATNAERGGLSVDILLPSTPD
ncbi:sensor histidine kinase [Noviherbaspirillum sp.]|uniref:sensor histidine kinase n=1 Tax=Noviherbaspirillum sp. TaxID=1926288 RepID=UPI002FDFF8DC